MNEEIKNENIQQAPQQSAPQEETPSTMQDNAPEKSSSGPIVGVAIIVIVLIAGGIYFWSTTANKESDDQLPTIQSGGETDAIVNQLNSQGVSDEIADIEADLNMTDLGNLDSELDDLLNEL